MNHRLSSFWFCETLQLPVLCWRCGELFWQWATLPGYGERECQPLRSDSLAHSVQWTDHSQLSENVVFRIDFTVTRAAQLYGFGAQP